MPVLRDQELIRRNLQYPQTLITQGQRQLELIRFGEGTVRPFTMVINTAEPGVTNSDQFLLPVSGTVDFVVKWGDGTEDTITSNSAPELLHTYPAAGVYTLTIEANMFQSFNFFGSGATSDREKVYDIANWGPLPFIGNQFRAFRGCINMACSASDTPVLSAATIISDMFENCSNFDTDISLWDMTSITSMDSTFQSAGLTVMSQTLDIPLVNSLENCFLGTPLVSVQDINAPSVRSMNSTFQGCNQLTSVGTITTTTVLTGLANTFRNCTQLLTLGDITDTSSVTSFASMFRECTNFNSPTVSNYNTSSATNLSGMFDFCDVFNQPVAGYDTSNVTSLSSMFRQCFAFNQALPWDVGNCTNFSEMLEGCGLFNQPSVSSWDTSSATNFEFLFNGCASFNQPLNSWSTTLVTNMGNMFRDCILFNQPLDNWVTTNVTNTSAMFYRCQSFNQDISGWDVSSVVAMREMFFGCSVFNQPLNPWSVGLVTDMFAMFRDAVGFNQPLNLWDTGSCTSFRNMFRNAITFNQDIGSWDVTSLTDAAAMFSGTSALSLANYSSLLIGWEAQAVNDDVQLGGGGNFYNKAAEAARDRLITDHNWTINDNGLFAYVLSGQITGDVVDNVLVTLTGTLNDTTNTDPSGNYSFQVDDGSYIVTPTEAGFDFVPVNINVTISGASSTGNDFVSSSSNAFAWSANAATIDTKSSGLKAYWPFDEFNRSPSTVEVDRWDVVGSNKLADNNIVPSNVCKNREGAVLNISEFFQANDSSDLNPTTGLLFAGWIRMDSQGNQTILHKGTNSYGFNYFGANADKLTSVIRQSDGTTLEMKTGTTLTTGTFYHIAMAVIPTLGKSYVYVDGTINGTPVSYDGTLQTNTNVLDVGRFPSGSQLLGGCIDEWGYWKDIDFTTEAELTAFIQALYNSGTGSFYQNDVLYPVSDNYSGDETNSGDIADFNFSRKYNRTGNGGSVIISTDQLVAGLSSGTVFERIKTPSGALNYAGNFTRTIDVASITFSGNSGSAQVSFAVGIGGTEYSIRRLRTGASTHRVDTSDGTTLDTNSVGSTDVLTGNYVLERIGNTLTAKIDSTTYKTWTVSGNLEYIDTTLSNDNGDDVTLTANSDSTVDENSNDVYLEYNQVPDEDTVFLGKFNGVDEQTTSMDYALGGNAPHVLTHNAGGKLDTDIVKSGSGTSYAISGAFGAVVSANSDFNRLTTEAWTWEGWFYFNSAATTQYFFSFNEDTSRLRYDQSAGELRLSGGGTTISASWTPPLNTWFHVAAVNNPGDASYLFVDGVQIATGANMILGGSDSYNMNLFQFANNTLPGLFFLSARADDVRVSPVARYTTAFTPPTEEFSRYLGT